MGSNEVEEFYEDPESLEERFPKTRKRSHRLAAVNLHYCFANGASYLNGHLTNLHERGCRGNILSVAVYHLPEFRYYYAVFEFDSIAAAELIYLLLNGSHGPIVFDLRFIADSVEFNHQPHVNATMH